MNGKKWHFPFHGKKLLGPTAESFSFRGIDIRHEVEVPTAPHPGGFGVKRRYDVHEGVDLYCEKGEPVYAVEAGRVVCIEQFTGEAVGCPWWEDTMAVLVAGASGIVVYGEIEPNTSLSPGSQVSPMQLLGQVITVLKVNKGRPMNMLHLELHANKVDLSKSLTYDKLEMSNALLNPTPLLLEAITH